MAHIKGRINRFTITCIENTLLKYLYRNRNKNTMEYFSMSLPEVDFTS